MVSRRFVLGSKYLEYLPGTTVHLFQKEIAEVQYAKENCLIVEAPTGAGKTRALSNLAMECSSPLSSVLLIVSPTNALATQTARDISKQTEGLTVTTWSSRNLREKGIGRNDELLNATMTSNVILSNPDILHLFTQNYYSSRNGRRQRNQTFEQGMSRLGTHVFDEYHSYDERMLASVFTYMIKARALSQCSHHRYVFLSATPNPSLEGLLTEFGISFRKIVQSGSKENNGNSREYRYKLDVEIVTGKIEDFLDLLPSPSEKKPRTLVVFDSFVHQHMVLNKLLSSGYREFPEGNVVSLTGRDTKSKQGQMDWTEAAIIMATSKADLGLNIDDLEQLIMEPGWYTSQFYQRFGRAGRSRPTKVVIVVPPEAEKLLSVTKGDDEGDLGLIMTALTRSNIFSSSRLKNYVGFYLAACEHNLNKPGINEFIKSIQLPNESNLSRLMLKKVESLERNYDPDDRKEIILLKNRLIESFSMLRGQSLEVGFIYKRGDKDLETEEDVCYILSRTSYERPSAPNQPYKILGFLEKPRNIQLSYPTLGNYIEITVPRGNLTRDVFSCYTQRLVSDLTNKSMSGIMSEELRALEWVLNHVEPDQIPPKQVISDEQFI